ncbi:PREDICTED: thionin-2.1-like [Camelina sativa]|uniref:Thionin-2.1-like n=1 Tax=Camelina sativa TaxID=90675 RepID=A0ABM0TLE4_CAMSA|nr:PREDICTED: thionin-2.1-like [Camelina sativa]
MKGKALILSLLIMSLVMAQIQVEASICCPSVQARNTFAMCYNSGLYRMSICIAMSGCQKSNTCPNGILENSGDAINEYCKLGCETSVCGAMNTLKNSDASEIVKGALEQCAKACSTFCTKSSKATLVTA